MSTSPNRRSDRQEGTDPMLRVLTKQRWIVMLALAAVLGVAAASAGAKDTTIEKKTSVALITDTGGLNDRSFNQLAYQGLVRAQKQLGVAGRVYQSNSQADYVPNLIAAARSGADVVIAVGFLLADSVNAVAKQFPGTKFGIVDVSITALKDRPKNVEGYVFADKESGYLAGYLSGLVVKARLPRTKDAVVASVGGIKIPPVDNYISGFEAGAKAAYPSIKAVHSYSQDFAKQAKCKEIALNQIADGASVIFAVAGGCGLGALDAARQMRVWGLESGADVNYLGGHMLGSALKKTDVVVFQVANAAKRGKLKTGHDQVFDTKSGGVGLGPVSREVPNSIVRKVKALAARFAAGHVPVIPNVK
jgi:basic membrane protein A